MIELNFDYKNTKKEFKEKSYTKISIKFHEWLYKNNIKWQDRTNNNGLFYSEKHINNSFLENNSNKYNFFKIDKDKYILIRLSINQIKHDIKNKLTIVGSTYIFYYDTKISPSIDLKILGQKIINYELAERQEHGFIFEKKICKDLCYTIWEDWVKKSGVCPDGMYTSKWDGIDENNGNKPVQIKTIQVNGSIEFGDIFRNSNMTENFILIVGFWKGKKENIVETIKIHVDYIKWNKLLEWNNYEELHNWIKNEVSNSKSYNSKWKEYCLYYKELWGKKRIFQPRFKRDSKSQRRIQCGISYNKFYKFIVKENILE